MMPNNIPTDALIEIFTMLSKIRKVELKIEELYPQDEMKTPVHLALGQEAVAVGICRHLRKEDYIFSNHRSHAHYLAKGGDLKAMIAEFYCKETGCSRGRGGSMHLIDTSVGHLGSSAIVGGSIPHAVGAALASVLLKKDFVAVSFFGDAASEQGVFFESMNLAKLKKLPVIFVCENNFYSVCSHISARQPNDNISMRARAFDIPARQVDGMDVFAVFHRAKEAVDHARSGQGPFLLECRVQRWCGHAGAGDPLKESYRHPEDLDETKRRDPLKDFQEYLLNNKVTVLKSLEEINKKLDAEIEDAFRYAQESPLPRTDDLEKYLFR
ncbi:MAG: thiamine pyrophosphate-dependent dehydrogenase E1 component subunit alpha [Candidatus Omnitrophota bacterium]